MVTPDHQEQRPTRPSSSERLPLAAFEGPLTTDIGFRIKTDRGIHRLDATFVHKLSMHIMTLKFSLLDKMIANLLLR